MASRIEWQQRDESSGYSRMQKDLGVDNDNPQRAAYRRLLEHYPACRTCMTMNEAGENLNLPCEVGDRLYEEYQETRRGPG